MQGVKQVIMLEDQRLHRETEFTGKKKEWDATITDLTPDNGLHGKARTATTLLGLSPSNPFAQGRRRVNLKLFYDSKGSPGAEEDFFYRPDIVSKRTCKGLRSSWRSGMALM